MSESGGSTFRPRGIHAALVTPFRSDETLDEDRRAIVGRPVGAPRRPLLSMTDQQRKHAVALLAQMGDIR